MGRWSCMPVIVVLVLFASPAVMAQRGPGKECRGWIAVESVPDDGASVILDGKDTGESTPATLKDVPCGLHTVGASKLLYSAVSKKVRVKNKQVVKARLEMKPDFAPVEIISDPAGAHIVLDGKPKGAAPLKIEKLEAGNHELTASFPDHSDGQRKFRVIPGKKTRIKVRLDPVFGQLVISTRAREEARVYLDGDALGTTPLTLKRVVAGMHTVKVSRELYRDFEKKVRVRSGKTTRVLARLRPGYGTLITESVPTGASVKVDGKTRGVTPLELRLSPGEHQIVLEGSGSSRGKTERKVFIKLRKKRRLKVKLPVLTGSLMIDTVPFAAQIELDGVKKGKAPLSLKGVPIGSHVLMARVRGLEPLTGRILVTEGHTAVAEMNMKEPSKSKYESGAAEGQAVASASPRKEQVAKEDDNRPQPKPKPAPAARGDFEPMPAEKDKSAGGSRVADEEGTGTELAGKKTASAAKTGGAGQEVATKQTRERAVDMPPTVSESRPMSTWRLLAWISTGTAGAAAVTSVVLFAVGGKKQADADDAWELAKDTSLPRDRRDHYYQKSKDLDDQAAALFTGGWVTGAFALAAGGAAVYFFLTEPCDGEGPRTAVHFNPLPGGGWVGIGGSF